MSWIEDLYSINSRDFYRINPQSMLWRDGMLPTVPSLLPGHYAIIKGREEGREGTR